jgi:short subunit dehydrogenase-like uncharacterized protein
MYYKKIRFPTQILYTISNIQSVRKLYVTQTILKRHRSLSIDFNKSTDKRRRNYIIPVPRVKTEFANRQYSITSIRLYNKINREVDIYNTQYHECKRISSKWLGNKTYNDVEILII